jgi:rubrerythrin
MPGIRRRATIGSPRPRTAPDEHRDGSGAVGRMSSAREPNPAHRRIGGINATIWRVCSMTSSNRAEFISRSAKGGLALVAGGSVLAEVSSLAVASGVTDADIAKLAATAELLAINFYTHAINSGKFPDKDERRYLHEARSAEVAHYDALRGVLGPATPKGLHFTYPTGAFASRIAIAKLGVALETAFVGAYLGAVTALHSNKLKGVAATIAAAESQHLSVFTDIASNNPIGPAFPKSFTAAQATAAVSGFIA